MSAEELVRTVSQCMRAGLDRNCQSGYGLTIYLLNEEGIATAEVKGRMD